MEKLDECARQLLDTTPQIMRFIRAEMRSHRGHDLSVPQFRTLTFINRNPEASLSNLANHLGLTLPSTSKLVDGLVNQKIITRHEFKRRSKTVDTGLNKKWGGYIARCTRSHAKSFERCFMRTVSRRIINGGSRNESPAIFIYERNERSKIIWHHLSLKPVL